MPARNTIKFINSLKQKKFRQQYQLFPVEGEKMVDELLKSNFEIHSIYALPSWIEGHGIPFGELPGPVTIIRQQVRDRCLVHPVNEEELGRMSSLDSPNKVLAVVHKSSWVPDPAALEGSLSLVLDRIQDPGNLGTLIRSADWFGVETIILSDDSAEVTNPKVVQATMGSVFRVRTYYTDLPAFLRMPEIRPLPVYGTFPDAPDIYSSKLTGHGLIVLGNESRGISTAVGMLIKQRISIPVFPRKGTMPESLNIAVAGSIIMAEFRRRVQ